jgi:hypothetical protein
MRKDDPAREEEAVVSPAIVSCRLPGRGVVYAMSIRSEELRIRYKYRKLILSGKARISLDSARALVGPDCAFHLYGIIRSPKRSSGNR